MKHLQMAILIILATPVLAGCSVDVSGLEKHVLLSGGLQRTYWLHVPAQKEATPLPLVIALHRFVETGPDMARITGFNNLADREGFAVAYPDGRNRSWNGFGLFATNDTEFLRNVVQDISARLPIDLSRVFVVGASSGGYMAVRAAVDARDVFAAAAVVMATMPASLAEQNPPSLPIMFIHGTEDPIVPYDENTISAGPGMRFDVLNVPRTVQFWVDRNGCRTEPVHEPLPDNDPGDNTVTFRDSYLNDNDVPCVVLCRVEGGGHTWPGGFEPFPRFIVGRLSRDFSATEAVWDFFQNWQNTD